MLQVHTYKSSSKQLGFTLLELLVVIAIIAILVTIGVYAFIQYNKTQQLNIAADDIENKLQTARSLAISQVANDPTKPSGSNYYCSPDVFFGYDVTVNNNSNTYTLSVECIPANATLDSQHYQGQVLKTYTAASNVTFTTWTAHIIFKRDGTSIGFSSGTISAYGQSKTITVSPAGVIQEQ